MDAQNQHTNLYNKRVVSAQRMDRPIGGILGSLPHSGVVVTLEDESTWLVHKGIIIMHGCVLSECMPSPANILLYR